MAKLPKLTKPQATHLSSLVEHFVQHSVTLQVIVENLERQILATKNLAADIHSVRRRVKDPAHLLDKLTRKAIETKASGKSFTITTTNLFTKVNDLAGVRLLHLHTEQFAR